MNDIIESIIYAFVTTFGMYIIYKIVVKQEVNKREKINNMEIFNFKVGDKVTLHYWHKERFITITAIGNNLFLGIDSIYGNENQYYHSDDWQLYQPKTEKVKLTKFYCSDSDSNDNFSIKFYKYPSDAKIEWSYVYTEKKFKEKFEVEI